jgi:Outer membrane protein beta-barrel domain
MAGMRRSLAFLLLATPLCAQSLSYGIKGGLPLTNALSVAENTESVGTQRWTVGPTVELNLPFGVSVGADALYRSFSFTSSLSSVVNSFVNSSSGHWEVPVYLKYRFGPHLLKPFVEAGVAFDRTGTSGTSGCSSSSGLCGGSPATSTFSSSQWGLGALVGGGVEIKALVVRIAPEIRYTRWEKGALSGGGAPPAPTGQPNQAEVLVGVRF